uniref:Alternative protein INSM2 n=1 Tax=Homo sapiens TaxID=9606 RepID=L8E9F8_HUMAN|nr:alternative protein INSM2 [Homo sapiens]
MSGGWGEPGDGRAGRRGVAGGWQGRSRAQPQPQPQSSEAGRRRAASGVPGALPQLARLRRVFPRGRRRRGRFLLLRGASSRTDPGGAVSAAASGAVPRARASAGPCAPLGRPSESEAGGRRRAPRQGTHGLRVWTRGRGNQEAKGHEEVELCR